MFISVTAVSAIYSASHFVDRKPLRFVGDFCETANRIGPRGAQVFSFFFRWPAEVGVGMLFGRSSLSSLWLGPTCSVAIVIRCCSIHRKSFSYSCIVDSASSIFHCNSSTLVSVSLEALIFNAFRAAFNALLSAVMPSLRRSYRST